MERFRANLRWVVGASATPYGYTLTVWTTGAIVAHHHGLPDEVGALGFAAGAVLAFAFAGVLAHGHLGKVETPEFPGFSLWQVLHLAGLRGRDPDRVGRLAPGRRRGGLAARGLLRHRDLPDRGGRAAHAGGRRAGDPRPESPLSTPVLAGSTPYAEGRPSAELPTGRT